MEHRDYQDREDHLVLTALMERLEEMGLMDYMAQMEQTVLMESTEVTAWMD